MFNNSQCCGFLIVYIAPSPPFPPPPYKPALKLNWLYIYRRSIFVYQTSPAIKHPLATTVAKLFNLVAHVGVHHWYMCYISMLTIISLLKQVLLRWAETSASHQTHGER